MKNVNLYNQDGSLCSEAQLLTSSKPDNVSRADWMKMLKKFRDQLSPEDLKEFERLRKNKQDAKWRAKNPEKLKQDNARWRAKNPEKVRAQSAKRRTEHPEKVKATNAKWYAENPEKAKANSAKQRAENPDYDAAWRAENPDYNAKWNAENPEKVKAYSAKWYAENPDYQAVWRAKNPEKLKDRRNRPENKLRSAVNTAFKRIGQNKPTDTLNLLGCTWEEAKAHFESLFLEGMTWENHGIGEGKWHIDHIRPVASFKGASEEELKQMNHISNLQPLWATDNLSKSDKWDGVKKQPEILNSEILNSEV